MRKTLQRQALVTVSFYSKSTIEDKSLYIGSQVEGRAIFVYITFVSIEDTETPGQDQPSDEDDGDLQTKDAKLQTKQEIENATVAAFLRIIYSSIR